MERLRETTPLEEVCSYVTELNFFRCGSSGVII